jgi:hypothetical protein
MTSKMGPANAVIGSGVCRGCGVSVGGEAGESVGVGALAGTHAVKMPMNSNPATSGRILGRVVFMMMLPFPRSLELPNGGAKLLGGPGAVPLIHAHLGAPGYPLPAGLASVACWAAWRRWLGDHSPVPEP